jgi:hypothetical protein
VVYSATHICRSLAHHYRSLIKLRVLTETKLNVSRVKESGGIEQDRITDELEVKNRKEFFIRTREGRVSKNKKKMVFKCRTLLRR